MELTKELIQMLTQYPLDYLHASLMDVQSTTREGKYQGEKRITLLKKWVDGRMPLIGIGSVYSGETALSGIEAGADLIALGRGLLLDAQLVSKIKDNRENEIINQFDATREDHHQLPKEIWDLFNDGLFPVPKKEA